MWSKWRRGRRAPAAGPRWDPPTGASSRRTDSPRPSPDSTAAGIFSGKALSFLYILYELSFLFLGAYILQFIFSFFGCFYFNFYFRLSYEKHPDNKMLGRRKVVDGKVRLFCSLEMENLKKKD